MDHVERVIGLLSALPNRIGLILWCNRYADGGRLQRDLADKQIESTLCRFDQKIPVKVRCVILIPEEGGEVDYPRWVRDPFIYCPIELGRVKMFNSAVIHGNEALWAENYIQKLHFDDGVVYQLEKDLIPVAGGNLLADHRFVLVGARQFEVFAQKNPNARGTLDLPGMLGYDVTAKLIKVGSSVEPVALGHLDLFLSLTGCLRKNTGRYIVLLAHCELLDLLEDPDLRAKISSANQYLDGVSISLEKEKFEVIRNPVPVLPAGAQGFYPCALNNGLVEVLGQSRNVWLPNITKGKENAPYFQKLREAEVANTHIWDSLGFKVRFIDAGFHGLMDEAGALHCMSNELQRGSYRSPAIVI